MLLLSVGKISCFSLEMNVWMDVHLTHTVSGASVNVMQVLQRAGASAADQQHL